MFPAGSKRNSFIPAKSRTSRNTPDFPSNSAICPEFRPPAK